ncbi:FadR/GntR family transcriptional regulator [Agromyces seonyuensis]|uniref:FadR/GntR family transcriptional regulator n=1 Tax=Agromyces seonyuensis TaxID=2662446 RepID=UPI003015133D
MSERAWELVLQHVESAMLAGDLAVGDRLPGERALSADLGVGRSSVREALRALEVLGLVRTATGSGPSAGAFITATPQGGMSALMRLQVAARGFPVADVVATRLLLERTVAERLAERNAAASPEASGPVGTGDDPLADARRLLDAMDAPGLPAADFIGLDAAFHLALAVAAGNEVVAATMAGLRSGIERYTIAGAEAVADWPRMAARLRAEHRAVLDAIDAGDPALAGARIHEHISRYHADTAVPATRGTRP